jgi:flagellar basal-body rod protein FlgG
MVRGLFTAWTGMANEQKRLDIISNNIANAATVGYKQENVTNQSFDNVLTLKIKDASEAYADKPIGSMSLGVKLGEVYTDFKQGSLRYTGNTFDLALEGNGFFNLSVENKNGDITTKYSRDGSFTMTEDGSIVDQNGNHLMGDSGEISVPLDTADISVDSGGNIFADGVFAGKIKITDFEDYRYLKKQGDTMYVTLDGAAETPTNATIEQGYTEQSNVNIVQEMVDMISVTRAYEANQKMIQAVDATLDMAVNSVGKV